MTFTNENPSSRSVARWNALFETLASPRRRTVLATLQREGSATVPELAAEIAETERSAGADDPPADGDAVEASLTHVHLPKLVHDGFVRWDRETDVVTPTETCRRLDLFFVSLEATVGAAEEREPVA